MVSVDLRGPSTALRSAQDDAVLWGDVGDSCQARTTDCWLKGSGGMGDVGFIGSFDFDAQRRASPLKDDGLGRQRHQQRQLIEMTGLVALSIAGVSGV